MGKTKSSSKKSKIESRASFVESIAKMGMMFRLWCFENMDKLVLSIRPFAGSLDLSNPGDRKLYDTELKEVKWKVDREPSIGCFIYYLENCKEETYNEVVDEFMKGNFMSHKKREDIKKTLHGMQILHSFLWGCSTWLDYLDIGYGDPDNIPDDARIFEKILSGDRVSKRTKAKIYKKIKERM